MKCSYDESSWRFATERRWPGEERRPVNPRAGPLRVRDTHGMVVSGSTRRPETPVMTIAPGESAHVVTTRFPELDILVNNLGIFEPKPFEQIPVEMIHAG